MPFWASRSYHLSSQLAIHRPRPNSFSFMRGLLPKYFSSEWSFAQFRVPETRTICAFGSEKNTIIGKRHRCVHSHHT